MIRELKFRGWDKVLGKWVDPSMVYLVGDGTLRGWGDRPLESGRFIIRFYTGLKDKNGIDIYEGDIIAGKFNGQYIERTHWGGDPDIVAEVYWDYSSFRLKAKGEEDERYADFEDFLLAEEWAGDRLLMLNNDHVEVIGNIYENPELLK